MSSLPRLFFMLSFVISSLLLLLIPPVHGSLLPPPPHHSLKQCPIIYVFTVVPAACKKGLPVYIKESIEQAVTTQPDCDVILASNYETCPKITEVVDTMKGVIKIDVDAYVSNKTLLFKNTSENIFVSDGGNELWLTSAYRFFYMEDIMNRYNYSELFHVEADNLLYGKISTLMPILRKNYQGLTATPLYSSVIFITASVFWISDIKYLQQFNDFLLNISMAGDQWNQYIDWLRPSSKTHGGINQDANGIGVKPFAVNEMSLLGYYHELHPEIFKLLPVIKEYVYYENRYTRGLNNFKPSGSRTGGFTGDGIWDPNSWGQYIGGTAGRKGRDKGFTDATHISGVAIRTNKCRPHMLCSNASWFALDEVDGARGSVTGGNGGNGKTCMTAPFVSCGEFWAANRTEDHLAFDSGWTPLWNLHVHSKHTADFRSKPCHCSEQHRFIAAVDIKR